ncbi:TPM domain-containing protein [Sandaracinobacter sp. RS1-74]|uniref:TPM domain-containing protein n=1 Tax=Sandaracinobacteroides sayramensis TaxID=2913411 RepID=UPI001EDBD6F7|nr:TPM domain-containing protein [Sandaracinobacteroides sayramensis]MCG2842698.1 TPM domain-containing protein [Sandaracinobacteroides sayramensis]
MRRLLALLLLLLAAPLAAQEFPALTGRVVDAADILPPDVEARISARSEQIEKQSGTQLVVATVPSLQGYEIEEYGYRLGRQWGIGQKREAGKGDNGVILLVAPNERRVRIEVGYGLEPILTDALSSLIIQNQILPQFRAGNMPAGVEAGFASIARQVELPPEEAAKNVNAAEQQAASQQGGFPIGLIFFLILLGIWFLLASRRSKGGRKARRGGPIVIWGPGMGGGWGGGGGGWGGGGFGGGGFGGGGGGFGGGGASGGW